MRNLKDKLEQNIPVRQIELTEKELFILKLFNLPTLKPIIYIANINKDEINF